MATQGKLASITTFDTSMPKKERVAAVAPIINQLIEEHEASTLTDGIETFQEKLMERVRAAGLAEFEWILCVHIAVHPDNREGAMLVPIDAHALLLRMTHDGWAWTKANVVAARIPKNETGQKWIQENLKLANRSNGLLPPYIPDLLRVATARGSHTSACVRIMELGARCVFEKLGENGVVSKSKIIEQQPSMREPLEKGLRVEVIDEDLVMAAPRLMEILSRTGNAGNNVFREQTSLQNCMRIYTLLAASEGKLDDKKLCTQASLGQGDNFEAKAEDLLCFVRNRAGTDGAVLHSLEAYERILEQKVKLYPHDLKAIGKIDSVRIDMFLECMVKAMLNSPPNYVDSVGYSTLFGPQDCAKLHTKGAYWKFAVDANAWMHDGAMFLDAYARLDQTTKIKLSSEFGINLVMKVMQKKADTRKRFNDINEIIHDFFNNVKELSPDVPTWHKLPKLKDHAPAAAAVQHGLREIRNDGLIPNSELDRRGYSVGKLLKLVNDPNKDAVYKITEHDASLKTCTLQDKDQTPFPVDRAILLSTYTLFTATEQEVWSVFLFIQASPLSGPAPRTLGGSPKKKQQKQTTFK